MGKKQKLATEPAAEIVLNGGPAKEKRESIWKDVFAGIVSNKASLVSGIFILLLIIIALVTKFVPSVLPYDPYAQNLSESLLGPSAQHWFGTDIQGRDIFCRVLVGTQITLTVGLAAVAISLTMGVLLGSIAGYKGGKADTIIMRIMDMMLAIPSILLAIAIMAALGPGIEMAVVAIGLVAIPEYARLVRSEILSSKENDYVAAARRGRLQRRHHLPPRAAERAAVHHRARDARHLHRHPGCGGARLPGPGRPASGGRVGRHAGTRPQRAVPRAVAHDLPRHGPSR